MAEEVFALNSGQQQVVDHQSGPLLVVAGAGTGKTRVIVEKINKLLDEGVPPSAILAVTFTEKAAAEMLDRILMARSGFHADLAVMTFNGFGESLLREFGTDIGIPHNFRLIGPQAQIIFFRERIDEFGLDYFLPLAASPDGIIEDILSLFSQLKQHIITPETYQSYADSLPQNDEAQSLEKKKHQELSGAYATYMRLTRTENVIDYDDQIYLPIQLLETRPNVRKTLQQRFHTLFIDEFQDTNPMQSRLIDLLVNGRQNLIVVGDDDQSIYGFRGATLQNILSFKERYPDAAEAALTQNYRSHQAILDAAYRLIQYNNPNRLEASLGINKVLTSDQTGQAPLIKRFNDINDELEWLATDIAARIAAGDDPGQIAVLTRSNPIARQVHDALLVAGVQHRVVGASQDLYTRPVVRMLLEFARTLAEPNNNASLHHTLVSDLFTISNELIAPFASQARYEHERLEDLLAASDSQEILRAVTLINSLREDAASVSVGRLLWRGIGETGYKDRLLTRASDDDQAAASIQHLKQFFDSLREFESIATQPTTAQYLVSLPALMAAGETTEDGTLNIPDGEVTVTTIHKAKGLEWQTVYLPCLVEGSFPWTRRGGGLQLPEALRAASTSPADEHYAEERRLMYVALTRARQNLMLSFAGKSKTGTSRKPSRFIDEAFGAGTAESVPISDPVTGQQQSLLDIPIDPVPKVAIPANLYDGERIRLSVSQASALLECPLNFYYKFVLKAPEEATVRTSYGTQLHGFFEQLNKARQQGTLPPLEPLLQQLEAGWQKAGYVSRQQQERALARAKTTLSNFYNNCQQNPAPLFVEQDFEVELPGSIVLYGRLDVVLGDEDSIEIRDYKTGDGVRDQEKANRRAAASAQLTMYALAWQLQHDGQLPARLSLEFVDTNLIGQVKKTQRGIDGLVTRLSKAAECFKTGDFLPGKLHDYCLHPPLSEN